MRKKSGRKKIYYVSFPIQRLVEPRCIFPAWTKEKRPRCSELPRLHFCESPGVRYRSAPGLKIINTLSLARAGVLSPQTANLDIGISLAGRLQCQAIKQQRIIGFGKGEGAAALKNKKGEEDLGHKEAGSNYYCYIKSCGADEWHEEQAQDHCLRCSNTYWQGGK